MPNIHELAHAAVQKSLRTVIRHQRYIGKEREVDLLIGTLVPGAIISLITLRGNLRWSELDDCVKKSLTTALMFGRLFVKVSLYDITPNRVAHK